MELLCEAVADDMEEDRAEGRRRKDKGERIKEEKSARSAALQEGSGIRSKC